MKFTKQNDNLKNKATRLRKRSTLSEVLLWNKLKNKQFCGLDFDRQKVVNNRYILDFYCSAHNVALEIDGCSHDFKYEYDLARDNYLAKLGIKVLHIDDLEVKTNIENVLYRIESFISGAPRQA